MPLPIDRLDVVFAADASARGGELFPGAPFAAGQDVGFALDRSGAMADDFGGQSRFAAAVAAILDAEAWITQNPTSRTNLSIYWNAASLNKSLVGSTSLAGALYGVWPAAGMNPGDGLALVRADFENTPAAGRSRRIVLLTSGIVQYVNETRAQFESLRAAHPDWPILVVSFAGPGGEVHSVLHEIADAGGNRLVEAGSPSVVTDWLRGARRGGDVLAAGAYLPALLAEDMDAAAFRAGGAVFSAEKPGAREGFSVRSGIVEAVAEFLPDLEPAPGNGDLAALVRLATTMLERRENAPPFDPQRRPALVVVANTETAEADEAALGLALADLRNGFPQVRLALFGPPDGGPSHLPGWLAAFFDEVEIVADMAHLEALARAFLFRPVVPTPRLVVETVLAGGAPTVVLTANAVPALSD